MKEEGRAVLNFCVWGLRIFWQNLAFCWTVFPTLTPKAILFTAGAVLPAHSSPHLGWPHSWGERVPASGALLESWFTMSDILLRFCWEIPPWFCWEIPPALKPLGGTMDRWVFAVLGRCVALRHFKAYVALGHFKACVSPHRVSGPSVLFTCFFFTCLWFPFLGVTE